MHRGQRPTRSLGPLNAWEPVIYSGGRVAFDVRRDASVSEDLLDASRRPGGDASRRAAAQRDASSRAGVTRRVDSLVYVARARTTDPRRVVGAKPAAFCRWVFDLLGAEPQDDFTDVFPGSGGVMRAWRVFAGMED
ncbi:hypothetical protein QT381_02665 [Galbitalea sp. SE-J8]|uniref:hypothetical protein n=1 Tax=Galbitalea sp. SE-J8 TaxID=3054952 RepID=UPI00259CE4C4|nr:hypothetical protein [Galbitalea sp. SE-J8]MDM4761906.1 hypothetical protein [Galbitalea sp. SE-J8]